MNTTLATVSLPTVNVSKANLWIGRILTGLPALWLGLGGVMNQFDIPEIVAQFEKLGYTARALHVLGYVLIAIGVLLSFRRTAALGAVIASGYLGGAVATHASHGDPAINMVAPIALAVAIWGGLALRDERVRALSPIGSPSRR